jgi:hypothetical protein
MSTASSLSDRAVPTSAASEPVAYTRARRPGSDASHIRAADLEPYIGLTYISRLFKLMAVVMVLLMVAEVARGLVVNGAGAIPVLLGEVSQLIVFAGLLWGCGDLALLLIDIGHDLRATRILIGRQLAHHTEEHHAEVDPAMASNVPLPQHPNAVPHAHGAALAP